MTQTSNSGRIVTVVAVSQGNVFVANAGDTAWSQVPNTTNSNPPLNGTGVVYSAANNQKLYFADGTHFCYYDPSLNQVVPWSASSGSLPVGSDGGAHRLIATWRGRTVVSGLIKDPQDWFMSAVGDPTNWNYAPTSVTPTQAIAGNNAPQGLVGDVITGLCPYTDDVLIIFGDHTIWRFHGDPMAGGQIDLVSNSIGGVWGIPWAMDPYGTIYFVSNRMGIYSFIPSQLPQRISQPIEALLHTADTGANTIRLMWDDRFQGLHVFVSPTAAAGAATHFFWEQRTGAWWTVVFSNNNHNPLCCIIFDGNHPGDRVPLMGSWDGYVRAWTATATTDDGVPINSQVLLGPILTAELDDMLVKDLQAILATSSGVVSYGILIGQTAEAAVNAVASPSGTWVAGRNPTTLIRRAGYAIYISITATNAWAMESIRARIAGTGKVRRRAINV